MLWREKIDSDASFWRDYLPYLNQLSTKTFPDCEQLNSLLPEDLRTAGGMPVRFVCSSSHSDGDYENRIYTSGQVSTRPESWHDLFNAMVWLRFPRIKCAINKLHYHAKTDKHGRGRLRDALTLFDECGVILVSNQQDVLAAIAKRDWTTAFQTQAGSWPTGIALTTFGHAMLEKYLSPYKSMTANALLIQVEQNISGIPRSQLLGLLDAVIADKLMVAELLKNPRNLAPLPLAGIPGWSFCGAQTAEFYADRSVFRSAPDDLTPPPIAHLGFDSQQTLVSSS